MSDFPLWLWLPVAVPAGLVIIGCLVAVVVGPMIERWRDSRK